MVPIRCRIEPELQRAMDPLSELRPVVPDPGPAAAAVVPFPAARALELLAVFVGLPLVVRLGLLPGPRLLVLAVVTAGGVLVLGLDPTFDRRRLWSGRGLRGSLGGILLRTAGAAAVILALVRWLAPDQLLATPSRHLVLWLVGLALYPLLSAWPQEVLYRVLFFHRYRALFPGPRAMAAASGLAFALLHLVYPNAVAPLLALPAGVLLAWTYRRTGSIGPVWLEHSLYGLLLFTLGLGQFFYDGRG
jgi:membrane protease YdiL (CAAX protease family)